MAFSGGTTFPTPAAGGGGGGGGPAAADTTWTLVPGSGSYTWNAANVAAVGGDAISGAGLSMDGEILQIPVSYIASMSDSAQGFSVFSDGSQSGNHVLGTTTQGMQNTGAVAKFAVADMDPSAQFDLIVRSEFVGNPANAASGSCGILLWTQGASDYESRGLWWGWAGASETGGVANVRPTFAIGVAPRAAGDVWRGTAKLQTSIESWLRLHRGEDGLLHAEYKEAEADPWTEATIMGSGGWPDMFGSGTNVKLGFGMSFGGFEAQRIVSATLNYKAA